LSYYCKPHIVHRFGVVNILKPVYNNNSKVNIVYFSR
jgi:hypothetical protein